MIAKYIILAGIVAILSGCVSDEANRYYGSVRYDAVPVGKVQILTRKPSKPFTVIADFQSRGDSFKSIQKKAAKIGADAVIVTNLGGYASVGSRWAQHDPYSDSHGHIVGSAIKYNK
jgi:hypothetical protein